MGAAIKQQAHELIDTMPETATWADLLHTLELRADIDAGIADAKAGRLISTDDLRKEYDLTR